MQSQFLNGCSLPTANQLIGQSDQAALNTSAAKENKDLICICKYATKHTST